MEIVQVILDFLRVLAWPLVVLAAMLIFGPTVIAIVGRLKSAVLPGGASLSFTEDLSAAKVLARKVEDNPELQGKRKTASIPINDINARLLFLGLRPSTSGLDLSYYRSLANHDPTIALAGLRIELEVIVRNLAHGFKIDIPSTHSTSKILRRLLDEGAITENQYELAMRVLRLCNAAVHGQHVTSEQASDVINTADVLAKDYIAWLGWGFDSDWNPDKR